MPWEDLDSGIQEDFQSFYEASTSDRGLYEDNLFWVRPVREHDKSYDRWYYHQVWYPKNKAKSQQKQRERYAALKQDPAKMKALLERKYAWDRANSKVGSKRHAKRMQNQRDRRIKMMADPVLRAKYLEWRRNNYRRSEEKRLGQQST